MDVARDTVHEKFSIISSSLDKISQTIGDVEEKSTDEAVRDGLSVLQLKNAALMAHNLNLLYLVSKKLKGESIRDSAVVDRLIGTRVLMERIRPIEIKLKYQVERLLRLAADAVDVRSNGTEDRKADALSYRPNLTKLLDRSSHPGKDESGFDEEDDEEECRGVSSSEQGEQDMRYKRVGIEKAKDQLRQRKADKNGKYVPPKLVPMPFNQDAQDKLKKQEQKQFMKRYNSNVMRELREEFSEAPQELSEIPGASAAAYRRVEKLMKERQRQEEEYMTRLPPIKNLKNLTQLRGLSEIDRMVGALSAFKGKLRTSKKKNSVGTKRFRGKRRFSK